MKISLLNSRTDTAPRVVETDWGGVVAMLSTSRSLALGTAAYGQLDKRTQGQHKDGPAWIPGELEGPRCDENMRSVCALVLDFDALQRTDVGRLWAVLGGYEGFAHTSASHTEEHPKWRVVLPLQRPILAMGWKERWLSVVAWLGLKGRLKPDGAAKNSSRLYYLPTNLSDVPPNWHRLEGRHIELDSIPARRAAERRAPTLAMAWWSDDFVRQARNYLRRMGPAVEGVHGDDKTYRAACVVARDFALPEAQALELLREWNSFCEPPWGDEELLAKYQHALRYGTGQLGWRRNAFHHGGLDRAAVEAMIWGKKGDA